MPALPELPPRTVLSVRVGPSFEECLELTWNLEPPEAASCFDEFVVEMVIDHAHASRSTEPEEQKKEVLKPPANAMVKRVAIGLDRTAFIQGMPTGRHFLVTVVGKGRGQEKIRGPWARAVTLCPKTRKNRDPTLVSLDPMGHPRRHCKECSCPGYVPFAWTANGFDKSRCRRCGCPHTAHVLVETAEILEKRMQEGKLRFGKRPTELPPEAVDWDERECTLWFATQGRFHPRKCFEGETQGNSQAGRVSVVTPTTEARQHFHKQLWACFLAQAWPDKELIVLETYTDRNSAFLEHLSKRDPRLKYWKFQCKAGEDWSIGTKRNICVHLASGDIIANFDDDDLYAPAYLSTMVPAMEEQTAQAITLSGWYNFHTETQDWKFCDPIAWGLTKGYDESDESVKSWAYGYGFSYVFRRQAGLDFFHDDISFGEDYNFVCQIQRRKGARSVALYQDEFGICGHIQHGGNTSNSIPLRDVPEEEARALAVVELAETMEELHIDAQDESTAWLRSAHAAGDPLQRRRPLTLHLVAGEWPAGERERRKVVLHCEPGATLAQLLQSLQKELHESVEGSAVFRVPHEVLDDSRSEEDRDHMAATVLGIAFLAELPEAEEHLQPETKSGRQWRKLLEKAKEPLEAWWRIDLRTSELWLLPVGESSALVDATVSHEEEIIMVRGVRQKASAKTLKGVSNFDVRLPKGADVALLRDVLGRNLPPTTKVLAGSVQAGGGVNGLTTLKDMDPVPEAITVTELRGFRTYYAYLSQREIFEAMQIIRAYLRLPTTLGRLRAMEEEAGENRRAYHLLLGRTYVQEVYPIVARRFKMPEDALDGETFPRMCDRHLKSTAELSFLWLEVEVLAKLYGGAETGFAQVNMYREHAGLPHICTWEEFYNYINQPGMNLMEVMDSLRAGMGELLEPVSDYWEHLVTGKK